MGPEFKTKKKNASVMGNVLPPNNRVVHKSQVQKLDVTSFIHDSLSLSFTPPPPGEGVLPYITYTGVCRPTGS